METLSLSLKAVSFAYEGVRALDGLDLDFALGEIHGIVGANGAGKSTLVKILSGLLPSYIGQVEIGNVPIHLGSPADSIRAGIAISLQDPEFAWNLSARKNCTLRTKASVGGLLEGASHLSWYQETISLISRFHIEPFLERTAGQLSRRQLQVLQLSLALTQPGSVLVLDEPTTALTKDDKTVLFDLIRSRANSGACVIFISHRIEHVLQLSSTVIVLRDGRKYREMFPAFDNERSVINAMHDASPRLADEATPAIGKLALQLESVATRSIRGVNFTLFQGEILGIQDDVGRASELFRAIVGLEEIKSGCLLLWTQPINFRDIRAAQKSGVGYLPEDRLRDGVFPNLSILKNMVMISLNRFPAVRLFDREAAAKAGERSATAMKIKHAGLKQLMHTLSGGNQQKVLLSRLLLARASVILLEEPTAGMDARSRSEFRSTLRLLAKGGIAILVSSSDALELEELCHRHIGLPPQDLASLKQVTNRAQGEQSV